MNQNHQPRSQEGETADSIASLLIATRNGHKVVEIRAILGAEFDYHTLNEFPDAPRVIEDAPSFAGNATRKAVQLAQWIAGHNRHLLGRQGWVLADDSGLEVDALGGAPGVHSARFAALQKGVENSTDAENCAKLLQLLKGVSAEQRTARFRCVVALTPLVETSVQNASPVCQADPFEMQTQLFQGTCEGRIGFELRGQRGFGYDPLFFPLGYEQTFGELDEPIKNRLSHRARALDGLKNWFRLQYATRTR